MVESALGKVCHSSVNANTIVVCACLFKLTSPDYLFKFSISVAICQSFLIFIIECIQINPNTVPQHRIGEKGTKKCHVGVGVAHYLLE